MASRGLHLFRITSLTRSNPNYSNLWTRSKLLSNHLRPAVTVLVPIVRSSSSGQKCYNILASGDNFRIVQKVFLSTRSPAYHMTWNKISSSLLHKSSLTQLNFSCCHPMLSNRNQHLLSCSTYFLTNTAQRCPFSQLSGGQYNKAIFMSNILSMKDVVSKDLTFLNPVSSYSVTVHWRGLRGFPSNRADKQNQDKVSGKNIETTNTAKENIDADLKTNGSVTEVSSSETEVPKQLSLYQRFKKTYKEHGKVLVAVHLVTSAAWFSSFYALVRCGFDIVPYLENWNFNEKIISPFRSGGLGDLALTYLLYKLATPARYTVTIAGTNLAIRYFRKMGKIPQVPQEDTIRSLYREGKENIKRRSHARFKKMRKRNKLKPNGQTKPKS